MLLQDATGDPPAAYHPVGHPEVAVKATCALALLLCAALSAACAAPIPQAEPITLDFAAPESDRQYWEGLLDPFRESHPTFTVNVQPNINDETDVVLLDPFGWEDAMDDSGLLNLDIFIEEDATFDRSDFPAGALALFARDGKQWCVPFDADAIVMYYNRDLFDRAGLPYPQPGWNWSDFLGAAQAIRDPDAGIYGYLSPHSDQQRIDALLFMLTHDAVPFPDAGSVEDDAALHLDDPGLVEAITFWADLMHRYNVAPTREQLASELRSGLEGELAAKQEGKAGMWMDWYGARAEVEGLLRDRQRWGITTVPSDRRAGTLALGRGLCIVADAPSPQAAWELVAFVSRQLPESDFPARRSVAASESYVLQAGEEAAGVAAASLENSLLISPGLLRFSASTQGLFSALRRIDEGSVSVSEALSDR